MLCWRGNCHQQRHGARSVGKQWHGGYERSARVQLGNVAWRKLRFRSVRIRCCNSRPGWFIVPGCWQWNKRCRRDGCHGIRKKHICDRRHTGCCNGRGDCVKQRHALHLHSQFRNAREQWTAELQLGNIYLRQFWGCLCWVGVINGGPRRLPVPCCWERHER